MNAPEKPPRRCGRPTKLTPAVRAAIVELVASGVTLADAARKANVDPTTLFRAQARSAAFAAALEEAEAGLKPALVAAVTAAAIGGDWRAALAILERRWPAEWGRRLALGIGGDPTNPTPIGVAVDAHAELVKKMAGMTTEELRAFAPIRGPRSSVDELPPFPNGSPNVREP